MRRQRPIWKAKYRFTKKFRPVHLLELHTMKKDTYRIKEEITLPGTKESVGQLLLTDVSSELDIDGIGRECS